MNVTDQELRSFSRSQLLYYIFEVREEIKQNGYVYPYKTSWFDVPQEMRDIVIGEMDAETRTRFTRCSKVCRREAKRSKRFMYGIKIEKCADNYHISFLIKNKIFCPHFRYTFRKCDSNLESHGNKTIVYHEKINYKEYSNENCDEFYTDSRDDEESFIKELSEVKWEKIEDGEVEDIFVMYLEKFLEENKNVFKFLRYDDYDINSESFNWKHLKNLDYIQFVRLDVLEKNIMTIQQILKCKEVVSLPITKLSFDQLIQLEARLIFISSKDITHEKIKQYLKMWENGEISENIEVMRIEIKDLDFLDESYYTDELSTVCKRSETIGGFKFTIVSPDQREAIVSLFDHLIVITRI